MRHKVLAVSALATALALSTAACGSSGGSGDSKTVTIAYQKFGAFIQLDAQLQKVKSQYEAAHPGYTVKLLPIEASENDYYTKLSLMNRSPNTAPDVMYEDTFLVNTDIQAGFLAPIDDYLKDWADWSQWAGRRAGSGKLFPKGFPTSKRFRPK